MVLAGGPGIFLAGAGVFRRPHRSRSQPKLSLASVNRHLAAVSPAAARCTLAHARVGSAAAHRRPCQPTAAAGSSTARPHAHGGPHHARARPRDGFQHVRGVISINNTTSSPIYIFIAAAGGDEGVHGHGDGGARGRGFRDGAAVVEPRDQLVDDIASTDVHGGLRVALPGGLVDYGFQSAAGGAWLSPRGGGGVFVGHARRG